MFLYQFVLYFKFSLLLFVLITCTLLVCDRYLCWTVDVQFVVIVASFVKTVFIERNKKFDIYDLVFLYLNNKTMINLKSN